MSSRSLGSLTIDLIARTFGFEQGMDKAARTAAKRSKEIEQGFSKAFSGMAKSVAGFVAAIATVDTAIRAFNTAVDAADRVDELSARLGISTERLSTWGYAAKLSGTDLESLTSSLQKFSKTAASAMDEDSKQAGLFEALGVEIQDAEGNLRSMESLLPEIADAFKALNNETLEAAIAQELFGRSGAELLEFLNRGSSGIAELTERARELGIEISGETAGAAAEFKDRVDDLRAATQGWLIQLAGALLPAITDVVEEFTDFVSEGKNVEQVADDIAEAMRVVADTAKLFGGLIEALGWVRDNLVAIEQAVAKFNVGSFTGIGKKVRDVLPDWLYRQPGGGGGGQFSNVVSGASTRSPQDDTFGLFVPTPEEVRRQEEAERRLNRFLSGGADGGKGAKGGKSEAERQAEQIKRAYESLNESITERISLFGKEGEASKIAYQIQTEDLSKLDATTKAYVQTLQQQALESAKNYDQMVLMQELQEAADDAVNKETEAFRDQQQAAREFIEDLEFELALISMGNVEREKAIALRYAGAAATDEERKKIGELIEAQNEAIRVAEGWDAVQSGLADTLFDVATGAASLKDAVTDFFDTLAKNIARMISEQWAEKITDMFKSNATGTAASGGGFNWGSLIGALFGGGRATGGSVGPGKMYGVNESGMEMLSVRGRDYLLTGNNTGTITPAHQVTAGAGIVQNFYNPVMADRQTDAQRQREAASRMQRQMARA